MCLLTILNKSILSLLNVLLKVFPFVWKNGYQQIGFQYILYLYLNIRFLYIIFRNLF